MPLTTAVILVAVGLVLLLIAGDLLVRGAVAAALKAGVSPLVAGIVIVGFGTSLPEVIVSIDGALSGGEGLAHGNIVGSNIANLWLVLAVPALMAPLLTTSTGLKRSATATLIATAAWIWITASIGLNAKVGAVFLGALIGYITYVFVASRKADEIPNADELEGADQTPVWRMSLFIAIGLVGLPLAANFLITGGVAIAETMNISQELIGLTLLAVGTSLPEIGAAVAAAMRKHGDVVIGNVLGSNMFNLLAAGGAIALIKDQQLASSFHEYSHWAMGAATIMVALFIFSKRPIGRLVGLLFLVLYLTYIAGLVRGWTINDLPDAFIEPIESTVQ